MEGSGRDGDSQLEEEHAVEGVAHGAGEEEVAEQVEVGLQALCAVGPGGGGTAFA